MRDTESEIRRHIIDVLRKYAGRRKEIGADTRINFDLGMDGDDAWEFFEEIGEHFNIYDPQFSFSEYFFDEGEIWFWPLSLIHKIKKHRKKPLTVDDVVQIIMKTLNGRQG